MVEYIIQGETLNNIANKVRTLSGTTETMSPDAMANHVNNANVEIENQEGLLTQIVNALEGKAGGNGISLPTLTTPATESEVFEGSEYIDQSGNKKTGTFTINEEIIEQNNLITQIDNMVDNLPSSGGNTATLEWISCSTLPSTYAADPGEERNYYIEIFENTKAVLFKTTDSSPLRFSGVIIDVYDEWVAMTNISNSQLIIEKVTDENYIHVYTQIGLPEFDYYLVI